MWTFCSKIRETSSVQVRVDFWWAVHRILESSTICDGFQGGKLIGFISRIFANFYVLKLAIVTSLKVILKLKVTYIIYIQISI